MSRPYIKSHSPTHRVERVGELIRHALAEALTRGDIPDAALDNHPVTVHAVKMTPDLRLATVSVMPLGGEGSASILDALNRHQKELRALIARKINLKFAPELRFRIESSFDAQAKIDALLRSPEVARDLRHDEGDEGDAP